MFNPEKKDSDAKSIALITLLFGYNIIVYIMFPFYLYAGKDAIIFKYPKYAINSIIGMFILLSILNFIYFTKENKINNIIQDFDNNMDVGIKNELILIWFSFGWIILMFFLFIYKNA